MDPLALYQNLLRRFGHQYWWPSSVPTGRVGATDGAAHPKNIRAFEIAVGAILTQNTAWTNVEKAIQCMIEKNLMDPCAIVRTPSSKLAQCIRSSGYHRQKAKKLKIFSGWLLKNYRGDLLELKKRPLGRAREEFLSLWGIGEETADSILLYALGKPSFVIDTYTRRLCLEYGITFKTYGEYKNFFESSLPRSSKLFNEFHALIVAWGKLYRADKPQARALLKTTARLQTTDTRVR